MGSTNSGVLGILMGIAEVCCTLLAAGDSTGVSGSRLGAGAKFWRCSARSRAVKVRSAMRSSAIRSRSSKA